MSLYVIDASVAVKWFIPEPETEKARSLLGDYNRAVIDLVAPDLLVPEAANVFWKRAERGEITGQEARDNLTDLLALSIPLVPSTVLAHSALALAHTHRRSVYDCIYLALALERDCDLVTSDERLCNSIGYAFPRIKVLQSLPL
jgi:predicted nucleic acid-binding protein